MDNLEYLTTRLKARREALGLSQAAVAKLVGTSQSAICEWESRTVRGPRITSIERWSEALGLRLRCELNDWGRAS